MPRIPDRFKNTTFFLYPSSTDADKGENAQGTGFVVSVPCESKALSGEFLFAVSNYHVVNSAPVIRINRINSEPPVSAAGDISEWDCDEKSDIAVIPLGITNHALTELDIQIISIDMLLTKEKQQSLNIGIGDDVFMVGHFFDSPSSSETNKPFIRFGNISRTPDKGTNLKNGEGFFMLDMRSRSGYSGSPIFVYRTYGSDLDHFDKNSGSLDNHRAFITMLGMNFGLIPEVWEIDGNMKKVKGVSGMSGAIPGWKIVELLNSDAIRKKRLSVEHNLIKSSGEH